MEVDLARQNVFVYKPNQKIRQRSGTGLQSSKEFWVPEIRIQYGNCS